MTKKHINIFIAAVITLAIIFLIGCPTMIQKDSDNSSDDKNTVVNSSGVSSSAASGVPVPFALWKFETKSFNSSSIAVFYDEKSSKVLAAAIQEISTPNFTIDSGTSGNGLKIDQLIAGNYSIIESEIVRIPVTSSAASSVTSSASSEKGSCFNYLVTGNDDSFDTTSKFTISFWLKADVMPAYYDTLLVSRISKKVVIKAQASYGGYEIAIVNSNDVVNGGKIMFTTVNAAGTATTVYSNSALNASTNYYVSAVYDGSNMSLYIGKTKQTDTKSGAVMAGLTGRKMCIAGGTTDTSSVNNAHNNLDGSLDELAFYDAALTDAEISTIYSSFK